MPDFPRRDLTGITVTRSCPGCSPASPCGPCRAEVEAGQLAAARSLGAKHRAAIFSPYGDLGDGDDALLMTVLGETGPTTEANHAHRTRLLDAYRDAQEGGTA